MKVFTLKVAAAGVRFLAAIAKVFAGRRCDVVLISCQDDEPSQDILDLAAKLQDNFKIKVIAGKMRRSFGGALSFTGRLFTMLRYTAKAKVVVIDAYCVAVSIPKKRPGQTVVQLWHAPEAIKKFSLQITDTPAGYSKKTTEILCMHRNYDYILCPSDATRPFFEEAFGYPESAFVKLGLPSLDRIGQAVIARSDSDVIAINDSTVIARSDSAAIARSDSPVIARSDSDEAIQPLTVVYAPTFRDGKAVETEELVRAFTQLLPDAKLVLKLHPLDAAEYSGEGYAVVDKEKPLIEWYKSANVIITDYSGVAVEAAAAGVASYYYIYDIYEYMAKRGLNVDLRNEATGKYTYTDAAPLAGQIAQDFVSAHSYDYEALASFAAKYLEAPLSGNTEKLADYISGLIK